MAREKFSPEQEQANWKTRESSPELVEAKRETPESIIEQIPEQDRKYHARMGR